MAKYLVPDKSPVIVGCGRVYISSYLSSLLITNKGTEVKEAFEVLKVQFCIRIILSPCPRIRKQQQNLQSHSQANLSLPLKTEYFGSPLIKEMYEHQRKINFERWIKRWTAKWQSVRHIFCTANNSFCYLLSAARLAFFHEEAWHRFLWSQLFEFDTLVKLYDCVETAYVTYTLYFTDFKSYLKKETKTQDWNPGGLSFPLLDWKWTCTLWLVNNLIPHFDHS